MGYIGGGLVQPQRLYSGFGADPCIISFQPKSEWRNRATMEECLGHGMRASAHREQRVGSHRRRDQSKRTRRASPVPTRVPRYHCNSSSQEDLCNSPGLSSNQFYLSLAVCGCGPTESPWHEQRRRQDTMVSVQEEVESRIKRGAKLNFYGREQ